MVTNQTNDKIQVFRDLYISADAAKMAAAVSQLEQAMPPGWARDTAAESRTRAYPVSSQRVTYCFTCEQSPHRPAAMLILTQQDSQMFYVSNIVPRQIGQLLFNEYNAILEEFYAQALKPLAQRTGLLSTMTDAEAGPEEWLDAKTAELLRSFSGCANRGTGASHPRDRERWNEFVVSAHRSGSKLAPSMLARWLVEAEDWSPEAAQHLAIEYESGLELLAYAGAH